MFHSNRSIKIKVPRIPSEEEITLKNVLKDLQLRTPSDLFKVLAFFCLFDISCLHVTLLCAVEYRNEIRERERSFGAVVSDDGVFATLPGRVEIFEELQRLKLVTYLSPLIVSGTEIERFSIKPEVSDLIFNLLPDSEREILIRFAVDGLEFLISHHSDYFPTTTPPATIILLPHMKYLWMNVRDLLHKHNSFGNFSMASLQMFVSHFCLPSKAQNPFAFEACHYMYQSLNYLAKNNIYRTDMAAPQAVFYPGEASHDENTDSIRFEKEEQYWKRVPLVKIKETETAARIEQAAGRYDKSIEIFTDAWKIAWNCRKFSEFRRSQIEGVLARLYSRSLIEAQLFLGSELKIRNANHNVQLFWLEYVGSLYRNMGDPTEAAWFFARAQEVRTAFTGEDPMTIWTLEYRNAILSRLQPHLKLEIDERCSYFDRLHVALSLLT